MPLSEHEQRLLEQMERAMYAEDPVFAKRLQKPKAPMSRRRLLVGALVSLVGMGVVVLGVTLPQVFVGALGFVLLVAGGAWGLSPVKDASTETPVPPASTSGSRRSAGKQSRWSARWESRRDEWQG